MPKTYTSGGMEFPYLTTITSNILANGKDYVDGLLIHELAHYWSGDLVTLSNWQEIFINEGVTSYLTIKALELMYGTER